MSHYIVNHVYGSNPGVIHYEADALPLGIEALAGPCDTAEEAWALYWGIHPKEQFIRTSPPNA